MHISAYRKVIAALAGAFLTWAGTAYVPDALIDRGEWYALAVAVATVVGVYAVTNATPKQQDVPAALASPNVRPIPAPTPSAQMPKDEEWSKRATETRPG